MNVSKLEELDRSVFNLRTPFELHLVRVQMNSAPWKP